MPTLDFTHVATCPVCGGAGELELAGDRYHYDPADTYAAPCPTCGGWGEVQVRVYGEYPDLSFEVLGPATLGPAKREPVPRPAAPVEEELPF